MSRHQGCYTKIKLPTFSVSETNQTDTNDAAANNADYSPDDSDPSTTTVDCSLNSGPSISPGGGSNRHHAAPAKIAAAKPIAPAFKPFG